jgi:ornithine cyclodeaminase
MSSALDVIGIDALRPLLDRKRVLGAVREALIWQAEGRVQSPLPGQLLFDAPYGDCHIKFGHVRGQPTFAIKVATGFYDNPRRGLPVNHGLILVLDAETGAPWVLLNDEGWLTAWRTAAATALAAAALAPPTLHTVGIVGTGLQARLALEWLPETLGGQEFMVWGRSAEQAAWLAAEARRRGQTARAATEIDELLAACQLVVTATPSRAPLFADAQVRPGTHFVGLGADSPGKQELPPALFARAAHILTDDHAQCLDHGDFGNAVRAGYVQADADHMLGALLAGHLTLARGQDDLTIVDLTGLAAEDIAIAGLFADLLSQA